MLVTRAQLEEFEYQTLAPYACKSRESKGREHHEDLPGYRTSFQQDRDRILHFFKNAMHTECVGAKLRVRWTSRAKLQYELKKTAGLSHHAFVAELSEIPRVAARPE